MGRYVHRGEVMKKEKSAQVAVREGPWVVKFKDIHALLPFYLSLENNIPPFRFMGGILNWVFASRPQDALKESPEAHRILKQLEDSDRAEEVALVPLEGGPGIPSVQESKLLLKKFASEWRQEKEFFELVHAARKKPKAARGAAHAS
jgi:hypothetical protein